jgi:hypothetical protein
LAVAVIEPSFRTLLVTTIGRASLMEPGLLAALDAAIALPAVTVRTEEKHGTTLGGKAESLP